jgi:TonB family protein
MTLRFRVVTPVAVLLLCGGALLYAGSQDSKERPPATTTPIPTYPESESGLKSFIENMLDALRSGDQGDISSHLSNLTIPNHSAWFVNIFGPDEGHRLESKYEEMLPDLPNKMGQRFRRALDGQRTDVKISVFQKPVDPSARLARAITDAMIQPITLYSANGTSADQQSSTYLGYFVYVDSAFHYVDAEVYQALSTIPPPRIRQGSSVTAGTVIRQVAPIYPDEARAKHIQGAAVFHVIIGADGTIKEIEPVSGDPILIAAATDAVKQWKYKPTLLNGTPVEVDTIITVDFRLNR